MDFLLGVLGIFQIIFLPGLIAQKLLKWTSSLLEKLLVIVGLSLIVNYCVIFLLTILGFYNRIVLGGVILVEIAAILWLYRTDFTISLDSILSVIWDEVRRLVDVVFPKRDNNASLWGYYVLLLLAILSIVEILWAFKLFFGNLGSIFSAWDAVVSWNRWAEVWAEGFIPLDSFYYPQLIPINWSITYVLMNNAFLQFFAKSIMPVFTLLILLSFVDLYLESKKPSYLIGLVFAGLLLREFIDSGLTNGYVDIASAFFAFASVYMLFKTQLAKDPEIQFKYLLVGAVFAAGAAVAKQTGVYIALCYPILALYFLFPSADSSRRGGQIRRFVYYFAVISLIWASWYIFKEVRILAGVESSNLDTLINLSRNEYDKPSFIGQVFAAMSQFGPYLLLFAVVMIAFPFMDRFHKLFTILIAPYPILWAWLASYDMRNLAFFMPLFALLVGYSIYLLAEKLSLLSKKIRFLRIPLFVPLLLVFTGLLYLNTLAAPEKMFEIQDKLQRNIFSPTKNQMLYDIVAAEGPQVRVLTNYPMEHLPNLSEYKVKFAFDDYDVFLAKLDDSNVKYILMPNAASDEIRDYIDAMIEAGEYELIIRSTEWKVYTLIKIVNR